MRTFYEIAKTMNISQAQAKKIYLRAIAKLSHPKNKQKLKEAKELIELINKEIK